MLAPCWFGRTLRPAFVTDTNSNLQYRIRPRGANMAEAVICASQYCGVIRNDLDRVSQGIEHAAKWKLHVAKERVLRPAGCASIHCPRLSWFCVCNVCDCHISYLGGSVGRSIGAMNHFPISGARSVHVE